MSTTPPQEPLAAGEPAPAPPPGYLRDLFLFLLIAVLLFPLVQLAAVNLLAFRARGGSPELSWNKLIEQVIERHQYDAFFAVPLQLVYYLLLLGVLYTLVRVRRRLPFWSSLRLRLLSLPQLSQGLLAGVLLALLVNLLNIVFPPPQPVAFDRLFSSRAAALLVIAASLLMAPLAEEIIFRGYIYTVLERAWGMTAGVLVSGILFGSIHFAQLWPGYFQMFLLCVVGIVFPFARARTGTTLASIALHFGYNAAISALFLISPTFRSLPAFSWLGG
jgi:membrane protease YdiL (CAAX protease family)